MTITANQEWHALGNILADMQSKLPPVMTEDQLIDHINEIRNIKRQDIRKAVGHYSRASKYRFPTHFYHTEMD